ncbi:hypothetical protein AOQ84DRAFT_375394 [Glonium stellatum]|uniref:Uncharacterized protein n=1 Tax=Glonium stellatum TaxID=574774 RepID=A0A8E2F3R6_9PEZI|nr:hypothetical protein AOQ84DRAFT_375394 [Glonium stellatum]
MFETGMGLIVVCLPSLYVFSKAILKARFATFGSNENQRIWSSSPISSSTNHFVSERKRPSAGTNTGIEVIEVDSRANIFTNQPTRGGLSVYDSPDIESGKTTVRTSLKEAEHNPSLEHGTAPYFLDSEFYF